MPSKDDAPVPQKRAIAATCDEAFWVQKDAHWSKGPVGSSKPNPFVQSQAAQSQAPAGGSKPANGSKQDK